MPRIALVTGANRGLGFETARQLAQAGLSVIIGARDADKGAEAAERLRSEAALAVESVELDVADDASVRRAATVVGERHSRLDLLVNNAGILPEAVAQAPEVVDLDLFRRTFETNLFGAVSTTQHFLPLLRRAPAGRIVNVSTTMGSLADQSDPSSPYYGVVVPAYQSSKAALNSLTVGLSKLLAGTQIKVNAVCPGFVQTDLTPVNRDQAPLTAQDAARVVVRYALLDGEGPTGGFFDHDAAVAW
jgi:NAD(P)-dependent dehydrogenase (short-subunit alcohol dehydrogenase family)